MLLNAYPFYERTALLYLLAWLFSHYSVLLRYFRYHIEKAFIFTLYNKTISFIKSNRWATFKHPKCEGV
jgi:hypothetical protein